MDRNTALKQYFGHTEFRPGQEELVSALLAGRDVLGVMPTGAGKSICYQLPALLLPGVTLVISPLISLMQDQVAALQDAGIPALFLNSTLQGDSYFEVVDAVRGGQCKLLYVAPERLSAEGFISLFQEISPSMIAVDEAHCVSQWGQDFRPSYLRIRDFLQLLPHRPVLGAFTATATDQVKEDIARLLDLHDPLSITTGFDRPNLYFGIATPKDKARYVVDYISRHRGKSGIVYCATRKTVDATCQQLQEWGIPATRYHAGLGPEVRRKNQEDFVYDRVPVMVATNAFGMGIDKSNVSFVLHMNMPKDLESYYQEAGRAGRDGTPAECVLLFSPGDIFTSKLLIERTRSNDAMSEEELEQAAARDLERLDKMVAYCKTKKCLRKHLLNYFGEKHTGNCCNCSNCKGEFIETDITTESQMILSGVARIGRKYPTGLGVTTVVQMLRGSRCHSILERNLDALPTHGIMADIERTKVRAWIDALVEQGYLQLTENEYPVLLLTPKASAVLFHGEKVFFRERKQEAWEEQSNRRRSRRKAAKNAAEPAPENNDLYSVLKSLRMKLAKEADLPPYMIFSNATLQQMAEKRPQSILEFLDISGVGETKAKRYGDAFLDAIRNYKDD